MSGTFTIGQPEPITGKAHMVCVKCDLCKEETLFNPAKVEVADVEIEEIMKNHICKKPKKEPKKKRKFTYRKSFTEYVFGTRRNWTGPREESDDTL